VPAWRDVVDHAATAIGAVTPELRPALPPALTRHWRAELDDVQRRVTDLERCPPPPSPVDGLHAFAALAAARLGEVWEPRQLIDAAAAVELAYRATRHHAAVVNGGSGPPVSRGVRGHNLRVVLDGDWSITQAAVLVAEIGPRAYRLLVRGYGATQTARLSQVSEPLALLRAAVALGGLVAGVPEGAIGRVWRDADGPASPLDGDEPAIRSNGDRPTSLSDAGWPAGRWNGGGVASESARSAASVLAWAIASQSAGTMKSASLPVPGPIDVQPASRSTTTTPAVGNP
jgi:hypothetical protein